MDSNTQPPHPGGEGPPEDSPTEEQTRPGRGSKPTPEQLEKRRLLAENRQKERDRKNRTRQLIQMGGVCAAFGFDSPEQVEAILSAVLQSGSGPDRLRAKGIRETERWPARDNEWLV